MIAKNNREEINNSFNDVNRIIAEINAELTANNADDVADDVNSSISSLSRLLTSNESIFNQKSTQLNALASATANLDAAEKRLNAQRLSFKELC